MGYLLKKEDDKVLMFYSEPQYGYYRSERTTLSAEEYEEWSKEYIEDECMTDDMVWMPEQWYDTTMPHEPEAYGVEVSGFIVDCILQGRKLEPNKPLEFNCG